MVGARRQRQSRKCGLEQRNAACIRHAQPFHVSRLQPGIGHALASALDGAEVVLSVMPSHLVRGLYQQMIGRGLRGPKNGGKDRCLIINVADNVAHLLEGPPVGHAADFGGPEVLTVRELAEAWRAGFTRALVPPSTPVDSVPPGLEVQRVRTVSEALTSTIPVWSSVAVSR